MHILDVKVLGLTHLPDPGLYQATLMLLTDGGGFRLAVSAALDRHADRRQILHGLLESALQHLHALPHYRRGRKDITVCANALASELASA